MFGFIFSLLIGALAGYIAGRIMAVSYTHLTLPTTLSV